MEIDAGGLEFFENLHVTPPDSPTSSNEKVSPKQSPLAKKLKRGLIAMRKRAAGAVKKGSDKPAQVQEQGGSRPTRDSRTKRTRCKEPARKNYVRATDLDVLLGRGGLSNHHPGNQAYRQHILDHQKKYKLLENSAKTQMSVDIVAWVKARGGRFLKRDDAVEGRPFYIATDATARQKVSQALREDHTAEGRELKKARTKASRK